MQQAHPTNPVRPDSSLDPTVSEVQRLHQELLRTQAALADFAYTVSHDLRARVRHVLAYTQLAVEDLGPALSPEVKGHLDTASEAATQMGLQIDGLMKWAHLDQVELQPTSLCLHQLVQEVRQSLEPSVLQRQLHWILPSQTTQIHADPHMARDLLHHLLSNALKFTRTRPLAELHIGWEQEHAPSAPLCLVSVRDNGVGFKTAMQDKLFKVFQRLHSPHEFEGVGLGLALAKKIVERHGGRIWAQGAPDAGCCVSFTLPLCPQASA
ncbi:MAG: hypothetical protein EBR27_04510 [Betaproteobacteria bacterium]|nr:hypothetical protein [Betaproteobacteria bacterium]